MRREELELRLQDYLDGRLSDAERVAFEDQLARDPELARRVESYRKIGRTLREARHKLPPGFLARARARFEARHSPTRRWLRPLSWEAAGLAAAAVIIVALFLPMAFEQWPWPPLEPPLREKPDEAPIEGAPAPQVKQVEAELVEDVAEVDQPLPVDEATGARMDSKKQAVAADDAVKDASKLGGFADAERTVGGEALKEAPSSRPSGDLESYESMAPPQEAAAPAPERSFARQRDEAGPAAPPDADAAGSLEEMEPRRKAAESKLRRNVAQEAAATEPAVGNAGNHFENVRDPEESRRSELMALGAFELPEGMLQANEIRVIDQPEQWRRQRVAKRETDSASEAPDFAVQRVVLIGPRSRPIDCSATRLRGEEDALLLILRAATGDKSPPGGCAVVIPAGNRPVKIVEDW